MKTKMKVLCVDLEIVLSKFYDDKHKYFQSLN
jgi:hypothetical protein